MGCIAAAVQVGKAVLGHGEHGRWTPGHCRIICAPCKLTACQYVIERLHFVQQQITLISKVVWTRTCQISVCLD